MSVAIISNSDPKEIVPILRETLVGIKYGDALEIPNIAKEIMKNKNKSKPVFQPVSLLSKPKSAVITYVIEVVKQFILLKQYGKPAAQLFEFFANKTLVDFDGKKTVDEIFKYEPFKSMDEQNKKFFYDSTIFLVDILEKTKEEDFPDQKLVAKLMNESTSVQDFMKKMQDLIMNGSGGLSDSIVVPKPKNDPVIKPNPNPNQNNEENNKNKGTKDIVQPKIEVVSQKNPISKPKSNEGGIFHFFKLLFRIFLLLTVIAIFGSIIYFFVVEKQREKQFNQLFPESPKTIENSESNKIREKVVEKEEVRKKRRASSSN